MKYACLLFMMLPASADATVVNVDGLPEMLTSASVTVPMDPSSQPISRLLSLSHYDQTFTFTATGTTGPGIMWIDFFLLGTPYMGDLYGEENLAANASIGGSGGFYETPAWGIEGSTPTSATWELPFTFGVPQTLHIASDAEVYYSYWPPSSGHAPYLQGATITSGAQVEQVRIASLLGNSGDLGLSVQGQAQARALDSPEVPTVDVPEPGTWLLVLMGLGSQLMRSKWENWINY